MIGFFVPTSWRPFLNSSPDPEPYFFCVISVLSLLAIFLLPFHPLQLCLLKGGWSLDNPIQTRRVNPKFCHWTPWQALFSKRTSRASHILVSVPPDWIYINYQLLFFFFCVPQPYIWGSPFWVWFLRMWNQLFLKYQNHYHMTNNHTQYKHMIPTTRTSTVAHKLCIRTKQLHNSIPHSKQSPQLENHIYFSKSVHQLTLKREHHTKTLAMQNPRLGLTDNTDVETKLACPIHFSPPPPPVPTSSTTFEHLHMNPITPLSCVLHMHSSIHIHYSQRDAPKNLSGEELQ